MPEIQYLAYLHNALDQLRGEAATLQFFFSRQYRNPMVVRVAGLAYQKGFGGHFHNDNSIGVLRDIPGLVLAAPARGDDAARCSAELVAMAAEDGRVCVFLEPIALYHEKDLQAEGDGGWLSAYPPPPDCLLPGEVGVHEPDGGGPADLLLVSYANGLRLSLQAQRRLAAEDGIRVRVVDLRWLNPLPLEAIREHAGQVGRVLVVDECRRTGGGVADAIVADLAEAGSGARLGSVRAVDSFVPLGSATSAVLVGLDEASRTPDAWRPKGPGDGRSATRRPGPAGTRFLHLRQPGQPAGRPPLVDRAEELRAGRNLPALRELDHAERFQPAVHLRPANASPLIFLASLLDAEVAAGDHRSMGALGNSLGWYTAWPWPASSRSTTPSGWSRSWPCCRSR